MSLNEADTCRVYVTPMRRAAGWEDPPHLIAEQQTFTDGRVRIVAGKAIRGERDEVLARLERTGIRSTDLAAETGASDADPVDLICHLAFQRPRRTRRERAAYLCKDRPDFSDQRGATASSVLDDLLDQYTEHGQGEFQFPRALQVQPIAAHGNAMEIADLFGGALAMREAVNQFQLLLYLVQRGCVPDQQVRCGRAGTGGSGVPAATGPYTRLNHLFGLRRGRTASPTPAS
ncbi:MAG TPA: type I restriction-modification enzyme R subunit C-terminal domain-containing protein [Chromatiaceae bacterium]|nr:type I restriction-modification enzyme R subunit C-terminal domain-containing protein [Chromatiaceae bacterium]